ncbi:hypothetical protein, partial [Mycetohabitans sp. B6]|uniref:hypothetical protein n=1 Tax=Mycetohabitans sp. B6 TaxID=2841843 RepID=UPI001F19B59B
KTRLARSMAIVVGSIESLLHERTEKTLSHICTETKHPAQSLEQLLRREATIPSTWFLHAINAII